MRKSIVFLTVSFILGSVIFWSWSWINGIQLQRSGQATCHAITPYLQIGSYRTAQEIARASLRAAYPGLTISFNFSGNRVPVLSETYETKISCRVPGREKDEFSIFTASSSRFYELLSRFGSSQAFSLFLFGFFLSVVQLTSKYLKNQLNQSLNEYFGHQKVNRSYSIFESLMANLPTLTRVRESIDQLTNRINGENERIMDLEIALDRRRTIAKYAHDVRSPVGALGIFIEKKRSNFSDDDYMFVRDIVDRLARLPSTIVDVEKGALNRERSNEQYLELNNLSTSIGVTVRRLEISLDPVRLTFASNFEEFGGGSRASQKLPISAISLDRLITNLADNAKVAGAKEVQLSINVNEDGLRIQFGDNGPGGIASDFLSVEGRSKSNGLGFEIVADILTAARSTATINSPAGQGTRIEIQIPLLEKNE